MGSNPTAPSRRPPGCRVDTTFGRHLERGPQPVVVVERNWHEAVVFEQQGALAREDVDPVHIVLLGSRLFSPTMTSAGNLWLAANELRLRPRKA